MSICSVYLHDETNEFWADWLRSFIEVNTSPEKPVEVLPAR